MKEEHTFWHKSIKTEENSQSSWVPKRKVWFKHNDDKDLGKKKVEPWTRKEFDERVKGPKRIATEEDLARLKRWAKTWE